MFLPYLNRFWKRFIKQRLFLLINIAGLSLGLGCCLLIGLFVWHEASYDAQYARADDIYLAVETWQQPIGPFSLGENSSQQLAIALAENLPGVEEAGRYMTQSAPVHFGSEQLEADEAAVHAVDPAILRIFDFKWLAGTPESAFTTPDEIALTRQLAEKYFGTTDVEGRVLTLNGDTEVRISGVIDRPATTILDFAALLPLELLQRWSRSGGNQVFDGSAVRTFVLLRGKAGLREAEAELPALLERQKTFLNTYHFPSPLVSVELKPLRSIHHQRYFQSNADGLSNGDRMKVFAAIGICVLLIAVMNYMNLSTSRYSTRALEVGVSLALGSGRTVLIRRFLGEAFVFTGVAMLLALMLAELLLPVLNAYVGMQLALSDVPLAVLGTVLLLSTLVVSVLAGAYPAFYLSQADPSRILRGELGRGRAGQRFREALVVAQFAAAISLLVIATVMHGQLRHLQTLERGFDPNDVAIIDLPGAQYFNLAAQWDGFAARLRQVPGVVDLTLGIDSPHSIYGLGSNARAGDGDVSMTITPVLPNYLQFYGIELLAGRHFLEASPADTVRFGLLGSAEVQAPKGAFILSTTVARRFGWSQEEALGQVLSVNGWGIGGGTVVGVVEDTIRNSNQERGALLYLVPETLNFAMYNGTVSLRLDPAELSGMQQRLRGVWDEYFPALPMPLVFLEDRIQADYVQEANQRQFFAVSALLVVLIACLGLYGLATFNAEHRTKEIGVRKVMGGSVWQIVLLLTNDFSRLVLIANVIAWPLVWVVMNRWLEQFTYRIDLTPMIFIGSGLIALCIAWVTVGGTAAKAASRKPVLALRYE